MGLCQCWKNPRVCFLLELHGLNKGSVFSPAKEDAEPSPRAKLYAALFPLTQARWVRRCQNSGHRRQNESPRLKGAHGIWGASTVGKSSSTLYLRAIALKLPSRGCWPARSASPRSGFAKETALGSAAARLCRCVPALFHSSCESACRKGFQTR